MFARVNYYLAFFVLILTAGVSDAGKFGSVRTWTSSNGKHTIEATLNGFEKDGIRLLTEGGKSLVVDIHELSEKDQKFVRASFQKWEEAPTFGLVITELHEVNETLKEHRIEPSARRHGVFVIDVVSGGPAADAGLRALDIVTHINGHLIKDTTTVSDVNMTLDTRKAYVVKFCRPKHEGGKTTWRLSSTKATPVTRREVIELREEHEKRTGPLRIVAGALTDNSIGTPELSLKLKNNSNQAVVAYKIEAECYDRFGDKVKALGHGSHIYRGIGQNTIQAGESKVSTWMLSVHDTTTKVIVQVYRVRLSDGSEWEPEEEDDNEVTIETDG